MRVSILSSKLTEPPLSQLERDQLIPSEAKKAAQNERPKCEAY